eukprot:11306930-Karenia_brevis.AAC.1
MKRNEELLRAVFDSAAELGNVPIMVLGDVNVIPDCSAMLCTALNTGRWFDADAYFSGMAGSAPRSTCFAGDSEGTRIDVVMCNAVCMPSLSGFT